MDKGFTLAQAAGIMSAVTGSAILCKFAVAWVADRVDLRLLLGGTALCSILLCLVLLSGPGYPLLFGASCATGFAIGGTFPLGNAMMARRFGASSVGSALGLMVPLISLSAMSLFYFTGLMHDLYGSYDMAFWGFIGVAILSIVLMPLIRLPAIRFA
jgi:MFS family permease